SIGLGSNDVSVYELVGAYATIMNGGFHTEPMFVTRIEDRNGKVIANFVPKQRKAISEETAALMIHMLKGGIEETGGTSQALWEYDIWRDYSGKRTVHNELACKTGTSNNHSDGWFVGMQKDLVSGMWVGGDDRSIHFRTSAMGEGSKTALPIYGLFMERIYKDQDLGIKMGLLPRVPRKLQKRIECPIWRPAAIPDSLRQHMDSIPDLSQFEVPL
ncbi:MAG: penicillin-binding protein, partial [Sphingobacteriales bacterium]